MTVGPLAKRMPASFRSSTDRRSIRRKLVAEGLNFPTSLAFDERGTIYVAESGLALGGSNHGGRVLRLDRQGGATCLREGLRAPVTGLTWHEGALYISEGGNPGRISRLDPQGDWSCLLDGLPGGGNYHTNEVAYGPDGWLYFGQGAMTNSGIVGPDALDIAWLKRLPHPHDIPGLDVELNEVNVLTEAHESYERAVTGPFSPFGTLVQVGQKVAAGLPCTSAVMRCRPDGESLQLVAWGFRNPYGLGFLPDGRLLCLDLGMNERGSRPIGNAPDCLFEVEPDWWYGWPDYAGGKSVTDPDYLPGRGPSPRPLLANAAQLPPLRQPLVRFAAHSAPVKFAVDTAPGGLGLLYVALFGDKLPLTGPAGPRTGRSIASLDPADWSYEALDIEGLSRPIDLDFDPRNGALHVLDFGEFEMKTASDVAALANSGKLWRVDL